MSIFDELLAEKSAFDNKAKELGKKGVKEELTVLFEKFPELEAVRWNQYTPYFNDGDPCEFRVGDLTYKLAGDDESGDYEDGFQDVWIEDDDQYKAMKEAISGTSDKFNSLEDVLLVAFGDHQQITATRNGVAVEEYDHE